MPFILLGEGYIPNTAWLVDWVSQPTWFLAWLILVNIVWIPLLWILFKEAKESWLFFIAIQDFYLNADSIYLAIDVPRDAEQSPASMEAIFAQLAGAHGEPNWFEQNWEGKSLASFSFEIVSIDGYVQYVIRVPRSWRDLVEASVYAQYPDAEITEIRDYMEILPSKWPDKEWGLFGAEWYTKLSNAFPIKTYPEFEDKIRGELVDPMAGLLEIMTKVGKDEMIIYQISAKPLVDPEWHPEVQKEIDKLIEKNEVHDRDNPRTNVMSLTPGEKSSLEAMEKKMAKNAFECKLRIAYAGKGKAFNKARGVGPVVGAIKQFNDGSSNFFYPSKKSWVKTQYAFKKARLGLRAQRFYAGLKSRSSYTGDEKFILNAEELATMYHFPMASVKAPLVKRTAARKSEPPAVLPTNLDGIGGEVNIPNLSKEKPAAVKPDAFESLTIPVAPAASANLPGSDGVQFIEIPEEPEDTPNLVDSPVEQAPKEPEIPSKDKGPSSPFVTGPEPPEDLPTE